MTVRDAGPLLLGVTLLVVVTGVWIGSSRPAAPQPSSPPRPAEPRSSSEEAPVPALGRRGELTEAPPLPNRRAPGAGFEMVTRGLAWLRTQQSPDGSWGDPATTGIALLAFLGGGHTHQSGGSREAVKNGLKHLRDAQAADGSFVPAGAPNRLRDHALAALAMVEAYGMTGSRVFQEPAKRGVAFAKSVQMTGSGWGENGVLDIETTYWMSMLVNSAKLSELDPDTSALNPVVGVLDAITDRGTGRVLDPAGKVSPELATAMGMSLRLLAGRLPSGDDLLAQAAASLEGNLPKSGLGRRLDDATWYLGTIAMWRMGQPHWANWMKVRVPHVDQRQVVDATSPLDGSWDPPSGATGARDRIWSTSLSLMGSYPYMCSWYPGHMLGKR